jgi:hypothetical protein
MAVSPSSTRRLAATALASLALTAGLAPSVSFAAPSLQPPPAPANRGYADPLSDLGAGSPACRQDVSAAARRNCRISGAVAHRYPLSSYGFDTQIGFSITKIGDSFLGALQSIAALAWMALVYCLKGVLLLLEWAFSVDLLGEAMGPARRTLQALHERVIGEPWFMAALSVAALWGIWRGLVQRQTSQTIAGLAATVGLMVCGLVIIANPVGTVGHASTLANQASLGVLAAATGRDIDKPSRSLSEAMIGVFDSVVRDPWCALEFGSVDWCRAPAARHSNRVTNADVWLAYPAGSGERTALYKLLKGEDPDGGFNLLEFATRPALSLIGLDGKEKSVDVPDEIKALVRKAPERARMQDAGGTFPRFALLALIAIGMTGAIALLGYLGIRLLLAAVLALLLLLFSPAVLLAPAFGEGGRATFIAWARRLIGALAAKVIYALFLAVVLAAAHAITSLEIGWFGTWLLLIAFWWGVLLKRHELLGFVSAATPTQTTHRPGELLSHAYYGAALARSGRTLARSATAHPRRAITAIHQRRADGKKARQSAVASLASEQLETEARHALAAQHARARVAGVTRREIERELRAVDRKLSAFDEARAAAHANQHAGPNPSSDQRALLAHRQRLQQQLASPELRLAEQLAHHADRTHAQTGEPIGPRDLQAHLQRRRRELADGLPVEDERNLRAAGIDPTDYHQADEPQREAIRATVEQHLAREQALLAASDAAETRAPRDLTIDPAAVRQRTAQERARLRTERRRQRARANLYRPGPHG